MESRHPKPVEDYTTANLILIFVNLLWILGVIWSTWGIVPVIVTGLILNHILTRIIAMREQRAVSKAPVSVQTPTDRAS